MTPTQLETDRAAFLRRICENPFDPMPRLIFADWLEDLGEIEHPAGLRKSAESGLRVVVPVYAKKSPFNDIPAGTITNLELSGRRYLKILKEKLFLHHPILNITLLDAWCMSRHGSRSWQFRYLRESKSRFPKIILKNLPERWSTKSAAMKALSRACVQFGRQEVGLPALVWPEV